MNNIASFLPNLPGRSPTVSQGPRSDSEAPKNSQGKRDGFDAVLSGLSANAFSEEPQASVPPPVRSAIPIPGAESSADALLPKPQASSTNASSAVSNAAAYGSRVTPTHSLSIESVSTPSFAKTAGAKYSPVQNGQGLGLRTGVPAAAQRTFAANASGPNLKSALPSGAKAATPQKAAASNSEGAVADKPFVAKSATPATGGTPAGFAVSFAAKADAPSGSTTASANVSANADAAISGAATAIAATVQSALPIVQSLETGARKTARTEAGGRPASASASKPAHKKSAETTAVPASLVDPAAQAAMAASIPPVSIPEALPANPDEQHSRTLSASLQINMRAQGAADADAAVGNGRSDAGAVSPDSFADPAQMTITTVSSATHFAPVARLSPVHQIADAVIGAIPDLSQGLAGSAAPGLADTTESEGSVAAAISLDPATVPGSGPVKTLNLELEPASLGTVTVTLHLSAEGLDVHLAANQSSTMNLINKDKDNLSDQLRQSGYALAGVAVTLSSPDGSGATNNGSGTQDPSGQSASQGGGQAMSYGGSSDGNGTSQNNARNGSGHAPQQGSLGVAANGEAAIPSRRPSGGDLYL